MFEIGNSLREARLRQALELPEAEAATKIRAGYLRALEEERFESLPAQTYIKGFLRSYADFLGLDGQLYVDEYNSRYAGGEEERPARARTTGTSRAHRRIESGVLLLALAGITVAAALVVVAWKWGAPEEARIPNLQDASAPATTAAQPPAAPPAQAQGQAPAADQWIALVVTAARGNSLLTVHRGSATGRLLFTGTLEEGESMRFVGERLWLDVGAPENVVATVDGRPAPLPPAGAAHSLLVAGRDGIRRAPTG